MAKYKVALRNPQDAFYEPKLNLHLHYYNASGDIDVITPLIERALKSKKLVDVLGNIGKQEVVAEVIKVNASEVADAIVAATADIILPEDAAPLEEVKIPEGGLTEESAEEIAAEVVKEDLETLEDLLKEEAPVKETKKTGGRKTANN